MLDFVPKKVYLQGILLHYFILKHTEFLLRLTATMLCWKQHAEIGFRYLKNNDFDEDKEHPGTLKKFEDNELEALLHEDSCQAQAELVESLGVDHTTVSKCLKALGMIQKLGHWVLYELNGVLSYVNSCFNGRKGKVFWSNHD